MAFNSAYGARGNFGTYGGMQPATFAYGLVPGPAELRKGVAYLKHAYASKSVAMQLQIASAASAAGIPGAPAWRHELTLEAAQAGVSAAQATKAAEEGPQTWREEVQERLPDLPVPKVPWMKILGGAALLGYLYLSTSRRRNPSFWAQFVKFNASGLAFIGGTALTVAGAAGWIVPEPFSSVAGVALVGLGVTLAGAGYEGLTGQKTDIAGIRNLIRNPRRKLRSRKVKSRRKARKRRAVRR